MKNKEIIHRIKELQHYYNVSDYSFAEKIGVDKSNLSKIYSGQRAVGSGVINKIVLATGASRGWIANGEGNMFSERENKTIAVESDKVSDETIDGTPIYDIDATCGAVNRDIEFTEDRIIGSINVPEISRDSKIIFASGDSMLPLIVSGDRIVIREILSWDYFNYGQIYLILTDEYRLIKRVRRHADNDYILLRSDNTDYDDIDLHKSKIRKLFIVENILSIKNVL